MKRRSALDLVPALFALLALLLGRPALAQDELPPRFPRAVRGGGPPAEAPPPPVTEILVKLRDASDAADVAARGFVSGSRRPGLAAVMAQFELREGRRLFGAIRHRHLDRLFVFRSGRLGRDPQSLRSALEALRKRPEVEYAEPNALARASWSPDDPYFASSGAWGQAFPDLWGLYRIGAESAWERTRGAGVVVAVLDTGVDSAHPDLAGQMWENPGETGTDGAGQDRRTNGLDDDGNGFVDDWRGLDFTAYDADPADDNGHGTHVAGTIGAAANNGIGIAGVAPEARLMAVKVLDRYGYGWVSWIASGIDYAARNGAKVINLSLGGTGETPRTLVDVIGYAHDVLGVVVVAAAGNDGADVGTATEGSWPANIRDVIAVGATDHEDRKATFSNFGAKLDLVAPGGGDTDPSGAVGNPSRSVLSLLSSTASASLTGSGSLVVGGQYLRLSGTSMATPHVAGAAALVRSLHPSFSPEQVRQALRAGASDLAPEGFDTRSGYGRLHADAALLVEEPLAVQITTETQTFGLGSPSWIEGTAAGPGLGSWTLEYGAGSTPSSWTVIDGGTSPVLESELASFDVTTIPDGAYTLRLRAAKGSGETFEDRLAVSVDNVALTSPASTAETPALHRGGEAVEVLGSANPAGFVSFTLVVRGKRTGLLFNPKLTLAGGGVAPVLDGLLGTWDTTGAPADHYDVCVRVTTATGVVEECSKVLVDPWLHPGWPRSVGSTYYSLEDHLTAEDVDGDGKKDLLVAYAGEVSVLDHAGNPLPGWPQSVGGAYDGALTGPVAGDLDGDGLPEVVAANSAGDVYVWSADGTLLPGWPMRVVDRFPTLALGDVDGDGANEIVISDWGPTGGAATLAVVGVDGTARPGWPVSFPDGALGPVSLGDVDGDGSTELVVVTQKPTMATHVFRGDGSPLAGWPRQVYAGSYGYLSRSAPALGDLDRDGALDVVLVTPDGKVHAYRGDGTPLPGWPVQTDALTFTNSPALGDLDGDGSLDVVVGGQNGYWLDYLYAWSRLGSALPGWPRLYAPEGFASRYFGYGPAALADVDGDGLADVVASADVELPQAFALEALRYDGSWAFGFPRPTLDLGASATNTAAFADLDGDGKLEMAWLDHESRLWVWDLPVAASASAPWPMFRHDARHSGAVPATHRRLTVAVGSTTGAQGTVSSSPAGVSCSTDASTSTRTCSASFLEGTTVTLSTSSGAWSAFEGWGGACSGTGACTVALGSNATVTASFKVTNQAPVASPGGPYAGPKGQPIAFDGSASRDPEGQALTYAWAFGDGTSGTGVQPAHAYARAGTFTATLTVSDGVRASAPATTTVVVTDGVPPAPVTSLRVTASTNRSVTLAWTATGDDGAVGTAAAYDLRYSTLALTPETFGAAFPVQDEPAPKPSGSAEALVVMSLRPGTTYFFAIEALDGAGNASPISNVVSVTTAPGVVVFRDDFEGGPGGWSVSGSDGKGGGALWHLSPHRTSSPTQAAYYGVEATKTFNTGARSYGTLLSAEIDLRGAYRPVLSLQHCLQKEASANYDKASVRISTDGGGTWSTLASPTASPARMSPLEADLSAYNRSRVRLRFEFDTVDAVANDYEGWVVDDVMITADGVGPLAAPGGPYSGFKRQAVAFDGSQSFDPEGDALTYSWDFGDGTSGQGEKPSHAYERAGTFVVKLTVSDGVGASPAATTTVTVQNRTPVANAGGPYAGARGEVLALSGAASSDADGDPLTYAWSFGDGTSGTGVTPTHAYARAGTFTVSLTVSDGSVTSSAAATTVTVGDPVPPSAVSTLRISASTNRSVTLAWTATGDDGATGTAALYDLRYSTVPLTEETFAAAFPVQDEPAPKAAGSAESLPVASLRPGTTYHFALKVLDAAGNASPLSNVVSATTAPGVVVFYDGFESGLGGWTVSGSNGKGGGSLWHLSPHRVSSPTQAAYYGIETTKTYDTGYRNYGAITSGEIDLRGAQRPVLSFQHCARKELGNYDVARVQVSTNGGSTWTTVLNQSSVQVLRMTPVAVDLSAYSQASVRLRFDFDSVDAYANGYEGWVVDDVMITADEQAPEAIAERP